MTDIAIAPGGAVWAGTAGRGISRWDGSAWVRYTEEEGLADNDVLAVGIGSDGIVWAGTLIAGAVNVWGAPAFVNSDAGDYHIGPGSATIDAGVDAGVTVDIDGQTRPQGAGYDLGADEYWPLKYVYLPLVLRNYP